MLLPSFEPNPSKIAREVVLRLGTKSSRHAKSVSIQGFIAPVETLGLGTKSGWHTENVSIQGFIAPAETLRLGTKLGLHTESVSIQGFIVGLMTIRNRNFHVTYVTMKLQKGEVVDYAIQE